MQQHEQRKSDRRQEKHAGIAAILGTVLERDRRNGNRRGAAGESTPDLPDQKTVDDTIAILTNTFRAFIKTVMTPTFASNVTMGEWEYAGSKQIFDGAELISLPVFQAEISLEDGGNTYTHLVSINDRLTENYREYLYDVIAAGIHTIRRDNCIVR